jgi:hypothetical protein
MSFNQKVFQRICRTANEESEHVLAYTKLHALTKKEESLSYVEVDFLPLLYFQEPGFEKIMVIYKERVNGAAISYKKFIFYREAARILWTELAEMGMIPV